VFDIAYLRCVPNLIVAAPRNEIELRNIMYTAQMGLKHPIAIRYPRGRGTLLDWKKDFKPIPIGKGVQLKAGENTAVLSIGAIANNVQEAIKDLSIAHYDMRFVKPFDEVLLKQIFERYPNIVTVENGTIVGGFGSAVLEFAANNGFKNKITLKGIPDTFIEHGTTEELQKQIGIDVDGLRPFFEGL